MTPRSWNASGRQEGRRACHTMSAGAALDLEMPWDSCLMVPGSLWIQQNQRSFSPLANLLKLIFGRNFSWHLSSIQTLNLDCKWSRYSG